MDTNPSCSFEEITSSRLKYGKYEKMVICILSLIFIADGIEVSALSLILPILRKEWGISESLQGLMGTFLFLGFFLGSLFASALTDRLGRRNSLVYVSAVQFFLGIYSAFINNVYVFISVRGVFGFILGFQVPLVPTLCAELIPIEFRGQITVIVNSLFSVGQFIATLIAYFCLKSLESGNWRVLLLFCSFPSIFVWFMSYRYMIESPRFTLLKMEIAQGIEDLNKIVIFNATKNVDKDKLFSIEKDSLKFKLWAMNINNHHHQQKEIRFYTFITSLFHEKYKRITICMWNTWFAINFVFYGLVFILPFFLNDWEKSSGNHQSDDKSLIFLLITTAGEGASGILAYFLVETHTFGRKYSLVLAQVISSIGCLISSLIPTNNGFFLIILLTTARFFGKMCFAVIYPLTAEIYPTSLRVNGVGVSSAIGRLASCLMPLITIWIFYINMYGPFILFFGFGTIGIVSTMLLPFDTRGRNLDLHNEIAENKERKDSDDVDDEEILSAIQI